METLAGSVAQRYLLFRQWRRLFALGEREFLIRVWLSNYRSIALLGLVHGVPPGSRKIGLLTCITFIANWQHAQQQNCGICGDKGFYCRWREQAVEALTESDGRRQSTILNPSEQKGVAISYENRELGIKRLWSLIVTESGHNQMHPCLRMFTKDHVQYY